MKRNVLVVLAGLCFAAAPFAVADEPQNPAQQTMNQGKDAAKQGWQQAQDAAKDGQKKAADMMQGAGGIDPKQMEEMMKSRMPGEHHKTLLQYVGDWDVKAKIWMAPGAPPEESTGTATTKSEFGGRFVFMTYKSEMMGQPFEGRLILGYNNNAKQNEAVWVDSMSTGVWYSTGNASSDGKVFTFTGTYVEPDGEKKTTREVATFKSPDLYVSEFFETGKDGKENKMMEITYTRKGKAATMKPAGVEPSK